MASLENAALGREGADPSIRTGNPMKAFPPPRIAEIYSPALRALYWLMALVMATIWRGGCVIRARFLDRIKEAYDRNPKLANLLLDGRLLQGGRGEDRRRVAACARLGGAPTPAFSSSLAYYDGLRRARGPTNLLQGLRDYFGAHTYRRLDREGSFHTRWSQDGNEVKV
jgi:6-phosphogluconate dehydrogenase